MRPTLEVDQSLEGLSQTVPVAFAWRHGGRNVYVTGTFTDWKTRIPLSNSHGEFNTLVNLPPGRYEYKYIVDGTWQSDSGAEQTPDPFGTTNNVIVVTAPQRDKAMIDDPGASPFF